MKDYKVSEMLDIANKYLDKMGRVNPKGCLGIRCEDCCFKGTESKLCLSPNTYTDATQINNVLAKAEEYINEGYWSKVEVDTKVIVYDEHLGHWKKRYFSHYGKENGKVYVFARGRTSFTSGVVEGYEEAKLYTEDMGQE